MTNPQKIWSIVKATVITIILCLVYYLASLVIPWLISAPLAIATVLLTFLTAAGLFLYSAKGEKYMWAWPSVSFATCVLLAILEKLAS